MGAPLNADIRGKILEATASLLKERSFADISLTDIARAAGISKGTLYYYYKSKADILFDIADRYFSKMIQDLSVWLGDATKDTSYKRFLRYVLKDGVYDESGNIRLFLVTAALSGDEEVRKKMIETYGQFKQALAQTIAQKKPEADAEHTAWMLLTMIEGLLVQSQLKNPELDIDAYIETMVARMDGMP